MFQEFRYFPGVSARRSSVGLADRLIDLPNDPCTGVVFGERGHAAPIQRDSLSVGSRGRHALCRVHAEGLVHKLDTFNGQHRAAQKRVRGLIWKLYADLNANRTQPSQRRSLTLRTPHGGA